jgi:hypothetical protein
VLAVFEMQGQHIQVNIHNAGLRDRFAPFRRLRRVYELVRAMEHTLTPLLAAKPADKTTPAGISTTIQAHLNELDQFVNQPQHFIPHTFDNINLLRSRLLYFISQPGTSAESTRELLDQIRHTLNDSLAALLAAIDETLATI